MRWLASELTHRDPTDDLADIDGGRFLDALSSLPQSQLQLLQESDMHVQLVELDGRYQPAKIVKMREREYNQGKEHFFVLDDDGRRVTISEEELDKFLGLTGNPDDVYNRQDVEMIGIQSEYVAPRDAWDVTYDATPYIRKMQNLKQSLGDLMEALDLARDSTDLEHVVNDHVQDTMKRVLISAEKNDQELSDSQLRNRTILSLKGQLDKVVDQLKNPEPLQDELIYSADWFPYPQDKRIMGKRAREIAEMISSGDLTKQQVGKLIAKPRFDRRLETIQRLKQEAKILPCGKKKGRLMIQAQRISQAISREHLTALGRPELNFEEEAPFSPTVRPAVNQISASDARKLWDLWQQRQIELYGETKLQPWQFRKRLGGILAREVALGLLTVEEAREKLQGALSRIYDGAPRISRSELEQQVRDLTPVDELEMPSWLGSIPPEVLQEFGSETPLDEEYSGDGMVGSVDENLLLECPTEDEWISNQLLDGGMD